MNVIVILNYMGVYFKEEFICEFYCVFECLNFQIVYLNDCDDLLKLIENNVCLCGVIFDWDKYNFELCEEISKMNENLLLYVFVNMYFIFDVSLNDLCLQISFFEYVLGVVEDIVNKIKQIIDEYINIILFLLIKVLFKYVCEGKYIFCISGYMGGIVFQKSLVGSLFYDFFGLNIMKFDIFILVFELGFLLDYSGLYKEVEQYIVCVFNVDCSYMVINGIFIVNKIVGMYFVLVGSIILIDCNCYKLLIYLMMMSDVMLIYFCLICNVYGIFGGILQSEFQYVIIVKCVKEILNVIWLVYVVIINFIYDGLLYNIDFIKKILDVKFIYFDFVWVFYINFLLIYEGKCGMSGGCVEGKVIYEIQFIYKLLVVFFQVFMIYVKGDVNEEIFNEVYMMYIIIFLYYGIVVFIEIVVVMMKGNVGKCLINGFIECVIKFCKEIKCLRMEFDGWFFDVWQLDYIDIIECWLLCFDSIWYGFKNIDNEYMYFDLIKVILLILGMEKDGIMSDFGILVSIVVKYFDEYGIVVEKIGLYNLLFLFSIGIDKIKVLSLLCVLIDFKCVFDLNLCVKNMLLFLYCEDFEFYENMCIQELVQNIYKLIVYYNLLDLMYCVFEVLLMMVMILYVVFQKELYGMIEEVYFDEMVGCINVNMIFLYLLGVFLVMLGEMIIEESCLVLEFLQMLCEIGVYYLGFEIDIYGVYCQVDGCYIVKVLKEESKK